MDTSTKQSRKQPISRAITWLIKNLTPLRADETVKRIEVAIEPLDLIGWLSNQTQPKRMYWSDRKKTFELAGLGSCFVWQGTEQQGDGHIIDTIQDFVTNSSTDVKIFGGMCFDHYDTESDWTPFGLYYFVLPQLEIYRRDEDYYLALNYTNDQLPNIRSLLVEINDESQFRRVQIPQLLSRSDLPGKQNFISNVADVRQKIQERVLDKAVLARKTVFCFDNPLNNIDIFHRLVSQAPNCFHFLIQPSRDSVFLGASPERLYRREKQRIKTEALAGTRSRGLSKEHDNLLKKELLESHKDRLEHSIVIQDILQSLDELTVSIDHDESCSLMTLTGGHHLITRIQADLQSHITDKEVLQRLHPTAAVNGSPKQRALDLIKELEPFSRGFYAGPVGYIGKEESEFLVAIRSGLIRHSSVSLFSGAGIVANSDPISEWEEIENKMNAFLKVLND